MIITAVRYRKLITGPGYSHQAVEAEAAVVDGDNPQDVLLELSAWVRSQISGEAPVLVDLKTLRNEVNSLYRQRDQLRGAVNQADSELKIIRDRIAQNTPKPSMLGDDAIPF